MQKGLTRRMRNRPSIFDIMNEFERSLFNRDELAPTSETSLNPWFEPSVDVTEHDNFYHFSFDLPGLKKDEINVDVNGNVLVVSGQREDKNESERKGAHLVERRFGRFERRFTLPENCDNDNIEANYQSGVLDILIPKKTATSAKKIDVQEKGTGLLGKFFKSDERKSEH